MYGKPLLKGFGYYIFCEMLCLFLNVTLAVTDHVLVKILSCICTCGILVCLMINYTIRAAKKDQKQSVQKKSDLKLFRSCYHGFCVSIWYWIVIIFLILEKCSVITSGFYRFYKLLNAPFLQLCNFLSSDLTAASLHWEEIGILVLCSLIPFFTVMISYQFAQSETLLNQVVYEKKER